MRARTISWGLIFIFAGTVFLLENYGIIDFNWSHIWRFWPVILIITGLNIIFSRSDNKTGQWLVVLATVFALGFITYLNLDAHKDADPSWAHRFDTDDEETDSEKNVQSFYNEDYDAKFKTATLNINGGASTFSIEAGGDNLFESSTQKNDSRYYLRKTYTDSTVVLNFNSKNNNKSFDFDDTDLSKVAMKIHTMPLWDINLNMGAGKAVFDLSSNQVRDINIKGGAADFEIKIGALYNNVDLSAETGIAKVSILIPTESGCKIVTKTGLSSKHFPGFKKSDDGTFTSPNYNTTKNKIMISLKGGLSDFEVKRY